jgi:predicted esterase
MQETIERFIALEYDTVVMVHILKEQQKSKQPIVLWGFSPGGALTVHLASKFQITFVHIEVSCTNNS